jgi:hypothetical protein
MGLLDRLFARSPSGPAAALVGRWRLTGADGDLHLGEVVRMEFRRGGQLVYTIDAGDRDQIMLLTWRVEGDTLVTDQPSAPRIERTKFTLLGADTLVLDYGSSRAWFERVRI